MKGQHNKAYHDVNLFISESKKVYGETRFVYDAIKEINDCHQKIKLTCIKCGHIFTQSANAHLSGRGCPNCNKLIKKQKLSTDPENIVEIFKERRLDNGRQYDYSGVKYVNMRTKVEIICPVHGPFWQLPNDHAKGCGCPVCKCSQLEAKVAAELNVLGIRYKQQVKFSWLGRQSLDFYLPDYNIAIECQGAQHYIETEIFGPLQIIKDRDRKKRQLCYRNNVRLYYVRYDADIPTRVQKILTKCK